MYESSELNIAVTMRVVKCGSCDLRFVVALSGEFTSGISINVALIIASIAFYSGIVDVGTIGICNDHVEAISSLDFNASIL